MYWKLASGLVVLKGELQSAGMAEIEGRVKVREEVARSSHDMPRPQLCICDILKLMLSTRLSSLTPINILPHPEMATESHLAEAEATGVTL